MAIYHSGIKINNLYHNGKKINKFFHNGKCIYTSIVVGESLYDGVPSHGIMLYGDYPIYTKSSNPLCIQGDSINLKAPLSSCPNGIKIHFSTSSYYYNGSLDYSQCQIPDISIPKGSSSGSSTVLSNNASPSNSYITAGINGTTLSFSASNNIYSYDGTVIYTHNDYPSELLAVTSITAY
ncbi:hypothetical protein [Lentilactobacillus buchneri]|uniref:hypothetical protein n=1 Tax=Lentilactobacillus buchneri TaxID=1581 RepID=UPI0010ACAE26|nr:hypothetical protein [Lentilactobacillus buchneri]TJX98454.1 hypothetical protein FCF17_10920 [Lentilactobacillus buchneri]TJY07509.1 hypothetical protein FCF14_04735 [Lentilactobacillus buchneri]TJY07555.1 hypothetical protein FCF14_04985 [Lentilactobacillus buchneri]TJY09312.1 hypothetical protein FCF18_10820 [Lentilactobacillus buchneri]TJY18026.1 hypothetical protein FCF16_04110 [Lentilactobacillus buchneri]